ncbi:hypothetical protein AN958_07855 [Leucoagaricus sp. SymC.cos]|nr:hypothetical protein AN958_07855 [Leucoagaricus sp. SymC.cos]
MSYRYSLLPTHSNSPDSPRKSTKYPPNLITTVFLSRRYARFSLLALFSLACIAFVSPHDARPWLVQPKLRTAQAPSPTMTYPQYPIPRDTPPENDTRPPLYEEYWAYEDRFPQHSDSLPFSESDRKFLFFADHVWGLGWGNAMQEMILNAQLAFESDRTFVFDDYTWERGGSYSDYNGKQIPSRVPLSALLAGPIAGHPFPNTTIAEMHPRAVSYRYFKQVCPDPYIINPHDVAKTIPKEPTAVQVLSAWAEKLRSMDDRCVEIQKDTVQVFDVWLLGSTRLHDIVPILTSSPLMKDFTWSPLVHYAFQRNKHHFTKRKSSLISVLFPYFSSSTYSSRDSTKSPEDYNLTPTLPTSQTEPLPLLALHLRRGDFIEHCDKLSEWGSTYTGLNTQPSLPDRFFAENATLRDSMSVEEKKEAYREKCLVDINKVRRRVIRAVKEWRAERLRVERANRGAGIFSWIWMRSEEARIRKMLRKVYIMTNGDREFLNELKTALLDDANRSLLHSRSKFKSEDSHAQSVSEGSDEYDYDFAWTWDEVATSRDLEWGWQTKYVAQAMDMYVGQRAEVFVGNGFSSLTANVVLLRTVAGVESWRTRFW